MKSANLALSGHHYFITVELREKGSTSTLTRDEGSQWRVFSRQALRSHFFNIVNIPHSVNDFIMFSLKSLCG